MNQPIGQWPIVSMLLDDRPNRHQERHFGVGDLRTSLDVAKVDHIDVDSTPSLTMRHQFGIRVVRIDREQLLAQLLIVALITLPIMLSESDNESVDIITPSHLDDPHRHRGESSQSSRRVSPVA
ncbi:MAG: hypothetical protein KF861_21010 [Planctomycetaceae bacterium]|nr:hypothetical protein [Planctomycetaceae bacterium]